MPTTFLAASALTIFAELERESENLERERVCEILRERTADIYRGSSWRVIRILVQLNFHFIYFPDNFLFIFFAFISDFTDFRRRDELARVSDSVRMIRNRVTIRSGPSILLFGAQGSGAVWFLACMSVAWNPSPLLFQVVTRVTETGLGFTVNYLLCHRFGLEAPYTCCLFIRWLLSVNQLATYINCTWS